MDLMDSLLNTRFLQEGSISFQKQNHVSKCFALLFTVLVVDTGVSLI